MDEVSSFFHEIAINAEETNKTLILDEILSNLINGPYLDLKNEKIDYNITFEEDSPNDLFVTLSKDNNPLIRGNFSDRIFYLPNFDSILKGGIAHELEHISRGDLSRAPEELPECLYGIGLREEIKEFEHFLPVLFNKARILELGKKCFSDIERKTDEGVIKRGLGREIYSFRKYCEYTFGKRGQTIHPGYYTSAKIAELIKTKNLKRPN